MVQALSLRQTTFHVRNVRTRMPFRYGAATLTAVPVLHVVVVVELDQGVRGRGVAADILPPLWFDKDPTKSYAAQVDDLIFAARAAAAAYGEAAGTPRSFFDLWRQGHAATLAAGDDRGLNHLTAGHGSSLMERALIDAVGRALDCTYHDLLVAADNPLGVDLGAILPQLAGVPVAQAVVARPRTHIEVRHTVGLADPLREADIAAADRLDDGLPQSLEGYLRQHGLRWLKVKVQGDLEADLERLGAVAALLDEVEAGSPGATSASVPAGSPADGDRRSGATCAISLDGNEQFHEPAAFADLMGRLRADLPHLHRRIAYVEQPLERGLALETAAAAGVVAAAAPIPVIIDESDGDLDTFARAAGLGYCGVSAKNCKGLLKALANAALARQLTRARGRPYVITGEDLMNLPVVPVHQDLTQVAALGLAHCERNGHHYVRGLDHLSPAERTGLLETHAGLYRALGAGQGGTVLDVRHGRIDVRSLQCPGLGVGADLDRLVDLGAMTRLDDWRFESLA